MKRAVDIVTTSRADFGIYRSVARELAMRPEFDVGWVVLGSHLSKTHGYTRDLVAQMGLPIRCEIPIFDGEAAPLEIGLAMSRAMAGMSKYLNQHQVDLLVVLGDRFEMFACVSAAAPFRVPIAHLHGGELTEGAMDDSFRHAITKLSHLHFVSTTVYAARVEQMGEEPWRIVVSGAPALDSINAFEPAPKVEIKGFRCDVPFVLVAYHAETLDLRQTMKGLHGMLEALDNIGLPVLITGPNADELGDTIRKEMMRFVADRPKCCFIENLGIPRFYDVMSRAKVFVGNSSSGIIEAASFGLPVVNIGKRQAGRIRGKNVINAKSDRADIEHAIIECLSPVFYESCDSIINPYGDGHAAKRIADTLVLHDDRAKLIRKVFADMHCP